MATIYKLKNISGAAVELGGIDFDVDEVVALSQAEVLTLRTDEDIFEAVATNVLEVQGDDITFNSPLEGWAYFEGDTMPRSAIEGNKIAVHTSYKPDIKNGTVYAIWAGAGDDMTDPVGGNGKGSLLSLETTVGQEYTSVDIEFNPIYGRVWLHEAYLKFMGAGHGDSISSTILSYPVALQQAANLDLIVDGDGWISYSPSGPGSGTHGFLNADISLIDRTFSGDGDWNFTPESGLTPNFAKNGNYKMSMHEQLVHRYVNRIPCYGDCGTYFSMSSDETTELLKGYFVRVELHNVSNTVWHASILMEIYREMTYSP